MAVPHQQSTSVVSPTPYKRSLATTLLAQPHQPLHAVLEFVFLVCLIVPSIFSARRSGLFRTICHGNPLGYVSWVRSHQHNLSAVPLVLSQPRSTHLLWEQSHQHNPAQAHQHTPGVNSPTNTNILLIVVLL